MDTRNTRIIMYSHPRSTVIQHVHVSVTSGGEKVTENDSGSGYFPLVATGAYAIEGPTSTNELVSTSLPNANTKPGGSACIGALPEEILVIILNEVITSESLACRCQIKSPNSRTVTPPPRRLAQVSRAWREIVFSCPLLWRHIHLTPFQSIDALKEQLSKSSPLPIHVVVHQWPFRNTIHASGPLSITALTAQLHSILSLTNTDPTGACTRVQSITIKATESSTFINFILQTWTGRGSKFPALRHVSMNGNLCATWSRTCFFDGKNAPGLDRLELTNVMISHNANRLPWGIGLNLTTLIWCAPSQKGGSLIISATLFHRIVASFPSLMTLEVHGQVLGLDCVNPENLLGAGVTPLTHIKVLRIRGHAFTNTATAFFFVFFFPSLQHLVVRGRSCTGSIARRTLTHAINAFIHCPRVLPSLEDLDLECVDPVCSTKWWKWAEEELERWKCIRSAGSQGTTCSVPNVSLYKVEDLAL